MCTWAGWNVHLSLLQWLDPIGKKKSHPHHNMNFSAHSHIFMYMGRLKSSSINAALLGSRWSKMSSRSSYKRFSPALYMYVHVYVCLRMYISIWGLCFSLCMKFSHVQYLILWTFNILDFKIALIYKSILVHFEQSLVQIIYTNINMCVHGQIVNTALHGTLQGWILTGRTNVNKKKCPFLATFEINLKRKLTLKIEQIK